MKIKKQIITQVQENWIRALKKLNFEIHCPYIINYDNEEIEVFAFLPNYGSENGIILQLTAPPDFDADKRIIEYAKQNRCGYSFINVQVYLEYKEEFFRETFLRRRVSSEFKKFSLKRL